ncbi:MAG: helix-turn-helix domain-containing protein [Planctomycetota bacterium JB042]
MSPIETLCRKLREARRASGMKQSELARHLDISQAAVSQYERGNSKAVARDTLLRACQILDVESGLAESGEPLEGEGLKFCEHADCLANVTYPGRSGPIVRPRMTRAGLEEATYCPECGDLLMDHCRNDDCGRPVAEGSFCTDCGTPYVPFAPAAEGLDRDEVLERTRLRIVRPA